MLIFYFLVVSFARNSIAGIFDSKSPETFYVDIGTTMDTNEKLKLKVHFEDKNVAKWSIDLKTGKTIGKGPRETVAAFEAECGFGAKKCANVLDDINVIYYWTTLRTTEHFYFCKQEQGESGRSVFYRSCEDPVRSIVTINRGEDEYLHLINPYLQKGDEKALELTLVKKRGPNVKIDLSKNNRINHVYQVHDSFWPVDHILVHSDTLGAAKSVAWCDLIIEGSKKVRFEQELTTPSEGPIKLVKMQ